MNQKKIAIVCAAGIGDALIMHMVSHHLQNIGYETTTFSQHLASFGPWFPGCSFAKQPDPSQVTEIFKNFDAIFLQHDNSPKAKSISNLPLTVYRFYGSHNLSKHGPLRKKWDFVCDPNQTMVDNTFSAMNQFFGSGSRENGLIPPTGLIHRKFKKRIAIHPTSSAKAKNWSKCKFHAIASDLKKQGYEPVFTVAPHERSEWNSPLFPTLADLSSFIYESGLFIGNDSGIGHLASYLNIPHLIIGPDPIQLRLWRPGWNAGTIMTPPLWTTQYKILKNLWRHFIINKNVIKWVNTTYLRFK